MRPVQAPETARPSRARATLVVLAALGALAAGAPAKAATEDCAPAAPIQTQHRIVLPSGPMDYVALAGRLPIRDGVSGQVHACLFYVAYQRPPTDGRTRPVTFIWNGGPGANSSYLNLEAFGPKRIASGDGPTDPPPQPLRLEDNPATLLDQSDLVFIDAAGTGFSRVAPGGTEAEVYNTIGDAAATAEFIRLYRDRQRLWDAPLFLMGESYGVWRAASVAERLETVGIRVAGVTLISGGVPVGPVLSPELKTALFIPQRTAAAFTFHKLAPDLQTTFDHATGEAERWAEATYAPALLHAEGLTAAQRQEIVTGLSRYTGLRSSLIDPATLVVPRRLIQDKLLADEGSKLGVLDVRDPNGEETSPARAQFIERYLRDELGFNDDLPYLGLGDDGYSPWSDTPAPPPIGERWNYNLPPGVTPLVPPDKAKHPEAAAAFAAAMDGPPGGSQPWLTRASRLDPDMRVFVAAGWFDSLNSCAGNAYLSAHLPPPLGPQMEAVCYRSGHMIYRDRAARMAFRRDLRAFYDAASVRRPR